MPRHANSTSFVKGCKPNETAYVKGDARLAARTPGRLKQSETLKKYYADNPRPKSVRFCKCGCGERVAEIYTKAGKFSGYAKYAKGHAKAHLLKDIDLVEKKRKGLETAANNRRLPIGTRRIATRARSDGSGTDYWQIKVALTGGRHEAWMFEHRYVMQQHLGRPLLRTEHVHHIDGNGLNNAVENLQVMSASEHTKLTGQYFGGPQNMGAIRRRPHRCSICRLFHEWPS